MSNISKEQNPIHPISWDIEISLLSNYRVWADLTKITLVVSILFVLLLGIPLGAEGEWEALGQISLAAVAGTALLLIIGILLLALITGNRFGLHYEISESGVICKVTDNRARAISRGTLLTGIMTGSLATTSTGLVTMAGEEHVAFWTRIEYALFKPHRHIIDLRGSWRSLLVIYCPPNLYSQVESIIRSHITENKPVKEMEKGPSLRSLILWTLIVILACLPLFVLPFPFEMDLLVPLILLTFSIASIWLVSPLAYIVLLSVVAAVIQIILLGLERHVGNIGTIKFNYSGFESLRGDDWVPLIIAVIGLLFLLWFALQYIRGRKQSALERDMTNPPYQA